MPSNVVKTQRDEELWNKAKQIVSNQYPNVSEGSDKYYALVMGIYQRMKGTGRRFGHPKTEAERRATHKARFGTTKLPPRGTGLVMMNPKLLRRRG